MYENLMIGRWSP